MLLENSVNGLATRQGNRGRNRQPRSNLAGLTWEPWPSAPDRPREVAAAAESRGGYGLEGLESFGRRKRET
jgi:hypothetical protein